MCGRFTLAATSEELAHHFNLKRKVKLEPRYNIAPSQPVLIIRSGTSGNTISAVRWGLIPHWAKDEKIGNKLMINARAETVREKPSFRDAFKSRRSLIPATGFYEWKHEGRMKQPYFIKMKKGELFGMAGIWESWNHEGKTIESCSIITTDANTIVSAIHDRMPVIIPATAYGLWLDSAGNGHSFQEYLRPCSTYKMIAYPVSSMVNDVKNEGEGCVRKIDY